MRVVSALSWARRRYARAWLAELMQLMAHLSRWLGCEHLEPAGLTAGMRGRLLADRRERYCRRLTGNAVRPLLVYLRGAGVVPGPGRQDDDTGVAVLAEEYRQYLVGERGLAVRSVRRYRPAAGLFGSAVLFPAPAMELEQLSARQVTGFVLGEASWRSTPDAGRRTPRAKTVSPR